MKNLIFLTIACLILGFTSCKKEDPITPTPIETPQTNWYDEYTDGGLLPNNTYTNPLIGTKWIVVKYIVAGLSTQYSGDTLVFVTYNKYEIHTVSNGVLLNRQYTLSDIFGGPYSTLTLNNFTSIGISSYSIKVGDTFISDGFVNNGEATDIYNTSKIIRIWLQKL